MLFLGAMFLTATVETFLLGCFGFRQKKVLTAFFILNLISNFMVNLIYQYTWNMAPKYILIPLLEIGVVVFEISGLSVITGLRTKLCVSVLLTNLSSYLLGLFLFGV